jgi:hypothetical protein
LGALDPIRAPERARFFVRLAVGAGVALGLIASLEWWLAQPMPRVLVVVAVSAALGWVAGRLMFRRKR